MRVVKWILSRLAMALFLGIVFVLLAYYIVFPIIVNTATRQRLSLDHFVLQSGSSAAGSRDAVYFAARYECRKTVTRITGEAPDALYWMIGIYDNRLSRIQGGHLNDTTVEVDEHGQFHLVIQPGPGNAQNTLECRKGQSGVIIMRVFLPDDPDSVQPPTIHR